MSSNSDALTEPTRAEVDASQGALLLEFGTSWCGHCQAAQSSIEEALAPLREVRHVKVEDGKGRALGRSFGVKLWPTLVFMRDGREVTRLVRPVASAPIADALELIGAPMARSTGPRSGPSAMG